MGNGGSRGGVFGFVRRIVSAPMMLVSRFIAAVLAPLYRISPVFGMLASLALTYYMGGPGAAARLGSLIGSSSSIVSAFATVNRVSAIFKAVDALRAERGRSFASVLNIIIAAGNVADGLSHTVLPRIGIELGEGDLAHVAELAKAMRDVAQVAGVAQAATTCAQMLNSSHASDADKFASMLGVIQSGEVLADMTGASQEWARDGREREVFGWAAAAATALRSPTADAAGANVGHAFFSGLQQLDNAYSAQQQAWLGATGQPRLTPAMEKEFEALLDMASKQDDARAYAHAYFAASGTTNLDAQDRRVYEWHIGPQQPLHELQSALDELRGGHGFAGGGRVGVDAFGEGFGGGGGGAGFGGGKVDLAALLAASGRERAAAPSASWESLLGRGSSSGALGAARDVYSPLDGPGGLLAGLSAPLPGVGAGVLGGAGAGFGGGNIDLAALLATSGRERAAAPSASWESLLGRGSTSALLPGVGVFRSDLTLLSNRMDERALAASRIVYAATLGSARGKDSVAIINDLLKTNAYVRIMGLDWRAERGSHDAVFLVNNSTKVMIVAFRGTEFTNIRDAANNFGFGDRRRNVLEPLLPEIEKYAKMGYHLTLTGHSLGGSLASAAASDLPIDVLQNTNVVTFNAPHLPHGYADGVTSRSRGSQRHYRIKGDLISYIHGNYTSPADRELALRLEQYDLPWSGLLSRVKISLPLDATVIEKNPGAKDDGVLKDHGVLNFFFSLELGKEIEAEHLKAEEAARDADLEAAVAQETAIRNMPMAYSPWTP